MQQMYSNKILCKSFKSPNLSKDEREPIVLVKFLKHSPANENEQFY